MILLIINLFIITLLTRFPIDYSISQKKNHLDFNLSYYADSTHTLSI